MSNSVELIPQDKTNACWLASSTMMRSWRDSMSHPLSDTLTVLDAPGNNFTQIYTDDNGLSFNDAKKIVDILGLTALAPASYTIDYFYNLLDVSPIMAWALRLKYPCLMASPESIICTWPNRSCAPPRTNWPTHAIQSCARCGRRGQISGRRGAN